MKIAKLLLNKVLINVIKIFGILNAIQKEFGETFESLNDQSVNWGPSSWPVTLYSYIEISHKFLFFEAQYFPRNLSVVGAHNSPVAHPTIEIERAAPI